MELKKYQKQVIADLNDYLAFLKSTNSLKDAYREFWARRGVEVGRPGIPGYHNVVPSVPHVCYKVPTGGGKTFLACASVKPLFDAMPYGKPKVVVWLVPSEAILSQTLAALKNPGHPYRQRLNVDLSGGMEVYSKDELLSAQNFDPVTISEQLSVMVLSYDSFRASRKEGRKAYQANGNLAPFATVLGEPAQPIENADETALFQVINQLNPIVIVDESHHATSSLSVEMLTNFNPSFILDLTATPKKESNIISYVDALVLKREHMVKLPVIAYNRASRNDVITDAIDLRRSLEEAAQMELAAGGIYIRPIVLFQAQPKTSEDATSFEKLRAKLIEVGVAKEQVAIKTATINELKNVDLASSDCPIRFIITVNALKEGWDCPFAYVLASLANKTSQVDVEQILGRVLRQPGTRRYRNELLNMSYVLTSSNDFQNTLSRIVVGLNNAGFTARDYRVAEELPVPELNMEVAVLLQDPRDDESSDGDFWSFDSREVAVRLEERSQQLTSSDSTDVAVSPTVEVMIQAATAQGKAYERAAETVESLTTDSVPTDLEDKVPTYSMNTDLAEEALSLRLPEFVMRAPSSALFSIGDGEWEKLELENLVEDFTLRDKDSRLDLSAADEEMYRIDVSDSHGDEPRVSRANQLQQQFVRQHLASSTPESRRRQCTEIVFNRINRDNAVTAKELHGYVERIVDNFDAHQISVLEESPYRVASKVEDKLRELLDEHRFRKFEDGLKTGRISVREEYRLASKIHPVSPTSLFSRSLYKAEEGMNGEEQKLAGRFSGLDNIKWWHRIIERRDFGLNGPINHYPDFMVMTTQGNVVLVESKGQHLRNDDSRRKLAIGQAWAYQAGPKYRYFMVFQDGVKPLDGAETVTSFIRILEQL